MDNIGCGVAGDLLPLYAENMVSEESRTALDVHLADCEVCRAKLNELTKDIPATARENIKKAKPLMKFRTHLLLNLLGLPLWLPLLIAAFAVILALYICMWAVALALWCLPLAFGAVGIAGIPLAVFAFVQGSPLTGVLCLAASAVGAGLAILTYFPCMLYTRLIIRFTVFLWRKCVGLFSNKKETERDD